MAALLALALSTTFAYVVVAYPSCAEPASADAIVVLGAAVRPDGQPSLSLRQRVERGVELYHAGVAPFLVMSGGMGAYPPAEADAMAALAVRLGVPDDAIVREARSTSTLENAAFVRAIAESFGWRRIVVVSDTYHLARARWMFRDHGFDVQTACASDAAYRRTTLTFMQAREIGALAFYAATRGIVGPQSLAPPWW